MTVDIINSLSFECAHFLLGNDLAGDEVAIDLVVAVKPCLD